jgi:cytochrome c oxidase assembly factor CtaG
MRTVAVTLFLIGLPSHAHAHGTESHGATASWTYDPWVVIPLLIAGILYALGSSVLARRSVVGSKVRGWHSVAYIAGWLSLTLALVSPLHWLGEHLFTFHMIEHEIVMAISAPLLVISRPVGTFLWSQSRRHRVAVGRLLRRRVVTATWRWVSSGGNATLLHGVAIWAWHAPLLFDAAVVNVTAHRLQHLSFLLTALLFWWSVLRNSESGVAAWHLFITMLHTSVLGALMALAPRVLYAAQTATALDWGLTPLEDQQLAGLIMWVPAGTIYAGATLAFTAIWVRHSSISRESGDAI